jgi:hypothetical protein
MIPLTELATKIIKLATENNCWVQHGRHWYTPEEFDYSNGRIGNNKAEYFRIRNPVQALKEGRVKVLGLLLAGIDRFKAHDIVDRMLKLQDKIDLHNYKPLPDQVDEVKIE